MYSVGQKKMETLQITLFIQFLEIGVSYQWYNISVCSYELGLSSDVFILY